MLVMELKRTWVLLMEILVPWQLWNERVLPFWWWKSPCHVNCDMKELFIVVSESINTVWVTKWRDLCCCLRKSWHHVRLGMKQSLSVVYKFKMPIRLWNERVLLCFIWNSYLKSHNTMSVTKWKTPSELYIKYMVWTSLRKTAEGSGGELF